MDIIHCDAFVFHKCTLTSSIQYKNSCMFDSYCCGKICHKGGILITLLGPVHTECVFALFYVFQLKHVLDGCL